MKILSPVGNMQSLKMAIFNGANEVYLGINNFNARNNIDGFSIETLQQAIDFAHIYNVKVLLAINILFSDNELQDALDTTVKAYNMGIDAVIVQDLGLAYILHKHYPQIELHASTQMGIHNLEGVQAILPFGFKRVVLARETPLAEIKRIKQNTNVELEYFAQGALCVSFSGNCYLSSYLNNASGNRGKCKQLCRLPYSLYTNNTLLKNGYLLSAKDINMLDNLQDLKDAGIDVLKIEGRARRPYYVALATRQYYNALNNLKVDKQSLQLAFNRNYTAGYFNGNGNIISDYSSHIGINVGKVEKFVKGKNFNEVYFTSNRTLSAKSTFKFFDGSTEKATLSAYDLTQISKNKYKLTTTQIVKTGYSVNLIIDYQHENDVLAQTIKKNINLNITANVNNPITATATINGELVCIKGDICQPANKQPITQKDITENFNKSDIFSPCISVTTLDNIFMPKQKLNEFRRNFYDAVFKAFTTCHYRNLPFTKIKTNLQVNIFKNFKFVESLNEILSEQNIVYSPSEYKLQDINNFIQLCTSMGKTPYLDTPNFALQKDIELLKNIIKETKISIIANNYYAINLSKKYIVGAGLNVYNSISANLFNQPIISAENNMGSKINFAYMTLRHCPLKAHASASCTNCPYSNDYKYVMESGKVLKLKRKKLSTCTFYLTD